ncbi:efflux RND transporter periplasmic adaptor subunit [Leptospira kmetyi]|uniref:efflux RND transporter periplasmic adaptor subunit n=1 Tax=Leptospira kmetyi TaxID=408139 RepID=UPI0010838694|nr:HlyD family efflux transporter periplasmic adaptor subunit [Leptospira kmetyi]TGK14984.1 HlyD family efflux transporter periplasmic adaptor subunit [Leptospira kmetyi]TGK31457.1 HlyD family efflux transporter periplasmic adaptor subunit [Leptospira kmetyi]
MNRLRAYFKIISESRNGRIASSIVVSLILIFVFYIILKHDRKEFSPKIGPIVELVYSLGTVKSDRVYHLKMGVTSSIRKLFVEEGQIVREGQLLLVSDSGATFNASFAGTVTSLPYREGEVVMPGTPVLTIMDLNKTYVLLSLDQDSMLRIRTGQRAELSFENLRGTKLIGKVNRVYPSDGQFFVRVDVDSMPEGVLPEMTADVAVEVAKKENALLIPVKAIEKGKVRVRRNGKTFWTEAKVGAIDGEWCEVLENSILPNDTIFLDGER